MSKYTSEDINNTIKAIHQDRTLLDMLLEGNLSEPILNFYSDASNFDGLELGFSYSFAGEELLDLSITEFLRIENVIDQTKNKFKFITKIFN